MTVTVRDKERTAQQPSPSMPGAEPLGFVVLAGWMVVVIAAMVWWLSDLNAQYLALGAVACLIVTVPVALPRYHLFSPWTVVLITTYLGCGVRGAFIALGIDGKDHSLQDLFLLGQSPEYFLQPSLSYILALAILTAGYLLFRHRFGARQRARLDAIHDYSFRRTTMAFVWLFAAIGFVALLLYVHDTGGFSLSALSAKRTTISGLDLSDDYQSHGVLRFVNNLSSVALWIAIAYFASHRSRRLTAGRWVVILCLALNAIALPFYASSRTSAVLILVVAWAIWRVMRPGPIPYKSIIALSLSAIAILGIMTVLRQSSGGRAQVDLSAQNVLGSAVEGVVYNRNFGDMETTSHIFHTVPNGIPFQNGSTIAVWVIAPIPRAIWPSKPIINVGPLLGSAIYGMPRSGVPPGFVGDSYLNFGMFGVLIGSMILGAFLGTLGRLDSETVRDKPAVLVAYYSVAFGFANSAMEKGIGAALYNSVATLVPVIACLAVVGLWGRTSMASASTRRTRDITALPSTR